MQGKDSQYYNAFDRAYRAYRPHMDLCLMSIGTWVYNNIYIYILYILSYYNENWKNVGMVLHETEQKFCFK